MRFERSGEMSYLSVNQQSITFRILRLVARLLGYGFVTVVESQGLWSISIVESYFVWPFQVHIGEDNSFAISNIAGCRLVMRGLELSYRRDAILLAGKIRDQLTPDECRKIAECTDVYAISADTRKVITNELKRFRDAQQGSTDLGSRTWLN